MEFAGLKPCPSVEELEADRAEGSSGMAEDGSGPVKDGSGPAEDGSGLTEDDPDPAKAMGRPSDAD